MTLPIPLTAALFALLAICLISPSAHAAPPALDYEAANALDAGQHFYAATDYPAALTQFTRARDLAPEHPSPRRWLGLTQAKLGDCDDAIVNFNIFVSRSSGGANGEEIGAAIKACKAMRAATAANPINAANQPPRSAVNPTPQSPPNLPPQSLSHQPPQSVSNLLPQSPPPEPEPNRALLTAGFALLGAGAAIALFGGIGFGAAAGSSADAIHSEEIQGRPYDPGVDADRERFNALSIASGLIGGGVAVVGAILVVRHYQGSRAGEPAPLSGGAF